jgi:hypothetical protein
MSLYANAQKFDSTQIRPNLSNPFLEGEKSPKVPEITPTLKPIYRSRVENAKSKLLREEQKLIKLARKTWDKEADLKAKKEDLINLENTAKNSNNPSIQRNIDKYKKQIAHEQDILDKEKLKVEILSKKVADFELAIEEARF